MIAPQPFFENRGVPISVYLRCSALAELDCEIDLITFPQGDDKIPQGVNHYRIPNLLGISHVPAGPSLRKLIYDIVMFLYLFWFLISSKKEYDCIDAHEDGGFLSLPHSLIFGLPLVYDYHSNLAEITRDSYYSMFAGIIDWMESTILKFSDAVICVIPSLIDHVKRQASHDDIFLIPDTAQEELINSSSETQNGFSAKVKDWIDKEQTTIVYTGSLAGYQTMDLFLEGLAQAENRDLLQFLLIGGTNSELEQLSSTIESLGLTSSEIMLTGRVPGNFIPHYLNVADLLVSPRSECHNTPLKIYTYMWSGKPMLVSDVECHRVIFDNNEVFWACPTADGYREALESLDEKVLSSMEEQIIHKYEQEYSYEQFCSKHEVFVDWIRTRDDDNKRMQNGES